MSKFISTILLIILITNYGCSSDSKDPTVFEIKIENTSSIPSFTAQNGAGIINVYSSVFAVVHKNTHILFRSGEIVPDLGLANLAENADPSRLLQTTSTLGGVEVIGLANEPSSGSIGLLQPGQSFTLLISASGTDSLLSLASSFMQGNDILVMSQDTGIPLFDSNGLPISGDITSFFDMYDIGTEVNEPTGIGPNQVLRQGPAPEGQISAGMRENEPVRPVSELMDGFFYPPVEGNIRISISVKELGTSIGNSSNQIEDSQDPNELTEDL